MASKKTLLLRLVAILLLLLVLAGFAAWPRAESTLLAANGYAVKWLCSGVFVSERGAEEVLAELPPNPLLDWLRPEVDHEARSATVSALGLVARTAVASEALGCTLVPPEGDPGALRAHALPSTRLPEIEPDTDQPWPLGDGPIEPAERDETADDAPQTAPDAVPASVSVAATEAVAGAVADAFAEPDPERPKKTLAVVVAQGGRLVAEQYAPGIEPDTPLPGWSMTKSLINALYGRYVHETGFDIHQPIDVELWRADPGEKAGSDSGDGTDPRRAITHDHLLRMSSGLRFDENYADLASDAVRMLFVLPDSGRHAASAPLDHAVDTAWSYSSGTTNLASLALRRHMDDDERYWAYPHEALFAPLGAHTAVIEADSSGTFVGSSFGWASARDWAKFGQLYLQDGVWNDRRLLPPGWVEYSVRPTPAAPQGRYGAQIWLNAGEADDPSRRPYPELPTDLYYFSGFQGQVVVVVPSRQAVLVRLGPSHPGSPWDMGEFVARILDALPELESPVGGETGRPPAVARKAEP